MLFGSCGLAGRGSQSEDMLLTAQAAESLSFTDATAWREIRDEELPGPCLELFKVGSDVAYQPPVRSPLSMAVVASREFGDMSLRVKARQTGRDYGHRDLIVVFAYVDATHFAYAHLASKADATAHHIMVVDGAPRAAVSTWRSQGVDWGRGWHDLQVIRDGDDVEVRFDGAPVLRGAVPTWRGRVGVGSFDDTGRFAGLHVDGPPDDGR